MTYYAFLVVVPLAMLGFAVWAFATRPKRCDIPCSMCDSTDVWLYRDGDMCCYDCGHVTNCQE